MLPSKSTFQKGMHSHSHRRQNRGLIAIASRHRRTSWSSPFHAVLPRTRVPEAELHIAPRLAGGAFPIRSTSAGNGLRNKTRKRWMDEWMNEWLDSLANGGESEWKKAKGSKRRRRWYIYHLRSNMSIEWEGMNLWFCEGVRTDRRLNGR